MTAHISYTDADRQTRANQTESLTVFPAGARLKSLGPAQDLPCTNADNIPPGTPVSITVDDWVQNIDVSQYPTYVNDFVSHWKARGWRATTDQRPTDDFVIMTSADGYNVNIQVTPQKDKISLTAGSPCVPPRSTTSAAPTATT